VIREVKVHGVEQLFTNFANLDSQLCRQRQTTTGLTTLQGSAVAAAMVLHSFYHEQFL
jgi:hypothetical protein